MFRVLYILFWCPFMLIFRAHAHHKERIPKQGFLLCANHTSMLDVIVLYRLFYRKIHFMAKKEAFKNPLCGWFLRRLGAFPVDRTGCDIGAIKEAMSWIQKGDIVCIFPQGTRRAGKKPSETPIYGGVGMIAYHTKADVLPVNIITEKWQTKPFHRTDLVAGQLITNDQLPLKEHNSAAYKETAQMIMEHVESLTVR